MNKWIGFWIFGVMVTVVVWAGSMSWVAAAVSPNSPVVSDDFGFQIQSFPSSTPPRIVSLAPSITEILFALDLGNQVIGNTIYCDYPSKARRIPKVGDLKTVNLEILESLNPDLVIASAEGNNPETAESIRKLGFPVFAVNPVSFETILDSIQKLGTLLSRREKARQVIDAIRQDYRVLEDNIKRRHTTQKVVMLLSIAPLIAVSSGSYLDDLIRRAGAKNLVSGSPRYPQISLEQIVALRPTIIFILGPQISSVEIAQFRAAVSKPLHTEIVLVRDDLLSRPGPRIVESIQIIAQEFQLLDNF